MTIRNLASLFEAKVEAVTQARKFMSAARAAARIKPVVVVKAGRHAAGARAAASHTGALAGLDAAYDAAFRRAGMLRVVETAELFDAVETLAMARPVHGDRLAILTNGGGFGVLATDVLMDEGGRLAELAPATVERLDTVLPPTWSRANPVDIIGDAPGSRYADALGALLEDPGADAVLVLNCPTAISIGFARCAPRPGSTASRCSRWSTAPEPSSSLPASSRIGSSAPWCCSAMGAPPPRSSPIPPWPCRRSTCTSRAK